MRLHTRSLSRSAVDRTATPSPAMPGRPRSVHRRRLAVTAFALTPLALATLGAAASPTQARPADAHGAMPAATAPDTERHRPPVALVDWSTLGTPAFGPVQLGDGWRLADVEGDGPFVGIFRDGAAVGAIEFLRFPLESLPDVQATLARKGERAALRAHARAYLDIFREDRAAGCGADYVFDPDRIRIDKAAGGLVVSYGFHGGAPATGPTEYNRQWAAIGGDDLVVAAVGAYDPDSCLPPEFPGLTAAQLDAVAPRLQAFFERNGLPR